MVELAGRRRRAYSMRAGGRRVGRGSHASEGRHILVVIVVLGRRNLDAVVGDMSKPVRGTTTIA